MRGLCLCRPGKSQALCFFAAASAAGIVGVWNYSAQSVPIREVNLAAHPDFQIWNAETKGDRLPVAPSEDFGGDEDAKASDAITKLYALAALTTTAATTLKPHGELREPNGADASKRLDPAKRLLNDAQIASIKTRLKLTPVQTQYWPTVEMALREVALPQGRTIRGMSNPHPVSPRIDVNSAEVQHLIAAAASLIMQLREDQKREVRTLMRLIGLHTVASQI